MDNFINFANGIAILLLFTSFVKIVTTLTIFRVGVGLHHSGFGLVIIAVALSLSMLIMSPQLKELGGVNAILNGDLAKKPIDYEQKFKPFLEKNSDAKLVSKLNALVEKQTEKTNSNVDAQSSNIAVLSSAFLLTELKEAFQLGLMILVPFVIIDLLVVNALMLLGITQISNEMVSLPLKILLFFAVDGWNLLAEKLIKLYI
jgi:flagellar biosynthesis protein FliP